MDQDEAVANIKSGTEKGQKTGGAKGKKRSGHPKTSVEYWKHRLRLRSYRHKGQVREIPYWQARIKFRNREQWFNTQTANKTVAAERAREFWIFLSANGWKATLEKFVPAAEPKRKKKPLLDIESFCSLYREIVSQLERPPRESTVSYYLQCLKRVCKRVSVKAIDKLTPEKINRYKGLYRSDARKAGRKDEQIEISLVSTLRNAASVFSEESREILARMGVSLENPFAGKTGNAVSITPYQPLPTDILEGILNNAPLLRDGDPNAIPPERKKLKPGQRRQPDFSLPQVSSYAILLLEIACGLRRKEADLAEWEWLGTDSKGRHFLQIKPTDYFVPKGRHIRTVPVEGSIFDELTALRNKFVSPFIVPGLLPPRKGEQRKGFYRCDMAHRTLGLWLRQQGITAQKPCHTLRKEYGSHLATHHGLFTAQRMLGHSSPLVTDTYYASLTDLPDVKIAKNLNAA